MNAILEDIIKMVEASSSFTCDDPNEEGYLLFSTRANGSVYDEEYSQKDVEEAHRVIKLIKSKYPELGVVYELDTCDEWVMIYIKAPNKRSTIFHFMKHKSRQWHRFAAGFSKGFHSMEELIENYGWWEQMKGIDLIKLKDTDIPDQTIYPFGKFNKIVQVYDAGDEFKYSYSIGFSFNETEQSLDEFFEGKGNLDINV